MITEITITRKEEKVLSNSPGWTLIYGRRKVGKTFLVRRIFPNELYILVKRGGGALIENGPVLQMDDVKDLISFIVLSIKQGRTVIVDEFQRLPLDFLDQLQVHHPHGKLILLGSSFHVAKDILSKGSPVLGLLSEVKVSVLGPSDVVLGLIEHYEPMAVMELSPYLRDPWALRFAGSDPVRSLKDTLDYSRNAIPALVGEVFREEDRNLTRLYEGIIRAIASGRQTIKEVVDVVHARGLIPKADPSSLRPFVLNMEAMDLIERVPLFEGKGNRYMLRSKLMDLHFYIDEKYGLERDLPFSKEGVIRERMPHHIESFIGELMGEVLGGTFRYYMGKDRDIDIIITRKDRPIFVGEVKWKNRISNAELERFLSVSSEFDCRKGLITPAEVDSDEIEVIGPGDLVNMVRKSSR